MKAILEALKQGRIVGFPTDTVYGIGGSYDFPNLEDQLFALKHRERSKSLVVYVNTPEMIEEIAHRPLSSRAQKLVRHFLPGALTLIVANANPRFPQSTLGFRIVQHSLFRQLVDHVGPLIGTSANLSGYPSSTSAADVLELFPEIPVLEGSCSGLESTVISADPLIVYREALIPIQVIENVLHESIERKLSPHGFSQHVRIYTLAEKQLSQLLCKHPSFAQHVYYPSPTTFYPILKQALPHGIAVMVYDPEKMPELQPYLEPYRWS